MLRIAICDDEAGTCTGIEEEVLDFAKSRALQIETEVFYSGEGLYAFLSGGERFDLVFLDIQLVTLDGVQVGRRIREELRDERTGIVYISSRETYAMSLFQVRPLDFLIKPVTKAKVEATLEKFIRLYETGKHVFYFHVGKSVYRLFLDEIRYFACNGRKIAVYAGERTEEFYGGMREVWQQVEGKGFWMIHKSYIVNSSFVAAYHYDSVEMADGEKLPISQRYRKPMKENLMGQYQKR